MGISDIDKKKFVNDVTDENEKVPENFGCFICQGTVYEPMLCKTCENAVVCKGCIEPHRDRDVNCQCGIKLVTKPVNLLIKNCLASTKVVCRKANCPQKQEAMTYNSLLQHFTSHKKDAICPLGCGTIIKTLNEAHEHYKNQCLNAMVKCERCECDHV